MNHTYQRKLKINRGRAESDPHNLAPTTPAVLMKNQKELTSRALAHGSCACDPTSSPQKTQTWKYQVHFATESVQTTLSW